MENLALQGISVIPNRSIALDNFLEDQSGDMSSNADEIYLRLAAIFAESRLPFCICLVGWSQGEGDELLKFLTAASEVTSLEGEIVSSEGLTIQTESGTIAIVGAYPLSDSRNPDELAQEYKNISFMLNSDKARSLLNEIHSFFLKDAMKTDYFGCFVSVAAEDTQIANKKADEIVENIESWQKKHGYPAASNAMNNICTVNDYSAHGGFVWFYDKYTLIAAMFEYSIGEGNVEGKLSGENPFNDSVSVDHLREYFSALRKHYNWGESDAEFLKLVVGFDELIENIDFSTRTISKSEVSALESFFCDENYMASLVIYGSISNLIADIEKNSDTYRNDSYQYNDFFDEDANILSEGELEQKLRDGIWWA